MSERGMAGNIVAIMDVIHWIPTHNSIIMKRNGITPVNIVENKNHVRAKYSYVA